MYLCIGEKKPYLGLRDESVSVASEGLRAACRLLIHIRCGWLQSVADDTARCWEMEGLAKWRRREERSGLGDGGTKGHARG